MYEDNDILDAILDEDHSEQIDASYHTFELYIDTGVNFAGKRAQVRALRDLIHADLVYSTN